MTLREYIDRLRGRTVAVIGIGVSNTPLMRLLLRAGDLRHRLRPQAAGNSWARWPASWRLPGQSSSWGTDYLQDLTEDVIFRTPGLRPDVPELAAAAGQGQRHHLRDGGVLRGLPLPHDRRHRQSDGKTTTTTIIAELLRAAGHTVHVGGNIGHPLLAETPIPSGPRTGPCWSCPPSS